MTCEAQAVGSEACAAAVTSLPFALSKALSSALALEFPPLYPVDLSWARKALYEKSADAGTRMPEVEAGAGTCREAEAGGCRDQEEEGNELKSKSEKLMKET